MKKLWISRQNSKNLLLFFNGWGMDAKPFAHLDIPDNMDILMIYDYTELEELDKEFTDYERVDLVAYSLGVYAASKVLGGMDFVNAVAINGTLKPISDDEGIAPAIFQGTIDSWSEVARLKFNRRMCGVKHNKFYQANLPERSVEDQKAELIALQSLINAGTEPQNIFNKAVISAADRIFPKSAQEKHWTAKRIQHTVIDEPHFYFADLKSWKDLLL